jgi:hypothetical protein
MSKDTNLPSEYTLQYGGVAISYESKLYEALDKGNVEEFKEELATIKESLGEDFDINKIRYNGSNLLSVLINSESKNKKGMFEELVDEGLDINSGVRNYVRDYNNFLEDDKIEFVVNALLQKGEVKSLPMFDQVQERQTN